MEAVIVDGFLFEKYRNEPAQSQTSDDTRKALGFHNATAEDLAALSTQKSAILLFLRGRWRTNAAILAHTGATESMRRVRELRKAGYQILKRQPTESGRNIEYTWTGKRMDQ